MSQNPFVPIVLADDHDIWRGGVIAMLDVTEFSVIGEASSGREAVALVDELAAQGRAPRLVLLDIRMNGGDGLEALKGIKTHHPQISVVMLTTYDNPTYMARAVAGGAAGYLLKGLRADEMLDSLRRVVAGESLLQPAELARTLRGIDLNSVGASDLIQPLSAREIEVLRLLSTGLSNRDIAPLLFISESTVKSHVEHIINKLGVSDRVQAAVWAARHHVAAVSSKQ